MKSTDSTNLIETVIASGATSGYVTTIPTNQATAGDGTISLTLGSPPECAISVSAGGKRPLMKDVNGVYKLLSAAIQSVQSWGILPYSSDFATAIGGYPQGAVCSDGVGALWYSTADDNTTVPGAEGATWVDFLANITTILDGITAPVLVTSSTSLTAPSWASRVEVVAVGAGGGGSDCQATGSSIPGTNASGGGGGSGAYARAILPITPGQSLGLNIGAAGASEGNGGATTVYVAGTLALTCGGGAKSSFIETGDSPGGYGGVASLTLSTGTLLDNSAGSAGGDGQNGAFIKSGQGGAGPWGGAGRDAQGGGENAGGFGAGGGGAYDSTFSGTLYYGGSGYQGCCIYRFLP